MNQINEFRDMISYCQIFNDQPKGCKEQAQNVSNAWYSFSRFIPGFLSELKTKINNDEIVQRIGEIIFEELGSGNENMNHAKLFYFSQVKLNRRPRELGFKCIQNLKNELSNLSDDSSGAYFVGISFGLEIIAEENISYLLSLTSTDEKEYQQLVQSAFFKIHFINEIDHINKCYDNYKLISGNPSDEESFYAGMNTSLNFWINFWQEAIHG